MKYYVVCVRDRAADVFGAPNFVVSIGGAIRSFSDEINREGDANNMFNKHPDDFDLYKLGLFDDQTATFECGSPEQIAVGKDLRIRNNAS